MTWAGIISLEPKQASVPKVECCGAEEAGRMRQAMCPHNGPGVPLAFRLSPQSRDPGGPSRREIKPTASKKRWNLWAGGALKCSLGISDFLEELSSLSQSVVFLCFFALITSLSTSSIYSNSNFF